MKYAPILNDCELAWFYDQVVSEISYLESEDQDDLKDLFPENQIKIKTRANAYRSFLKNLKAKLDNIYDQIENEGVEFIYKEVPRGDGEEVTNL